MIGRYLYNVMCGVSVLFNALVGGQTLQTFCARAGDAEVDGKRWGVIVSRFTDFFDKDHCRKARAFYRRNMA